MPAKTAKRTKPAVPFEHLTDAQFHTLAKEAWDDFHRLSKARQKALLIEWDILNPDGTLRQYPMDHVPLGPRQ